MRSNYSTGLAIAITWLIFTVASWSQVSSVTVNSTDSLTPPAITPGAPAGSYALSNFDTINPFNGRLHIAIPVGQVGGRGEASWPLFANLDNIWNYSITEAWRPDGGGGYENYLAALVEPALQEQLKVQWSFSDFQFCGFLVGGYTINHLGASTTRIIYTAPDGTETQFVDANSYGKPDSHGDSCQVNWIPHNRGRVFVATDGSGATFTATQDVYDAGNGYNAGGTYGTGGILSGTLQFSNGTTYIFAGNILTQIRDRNGNYISFTYDSLYRMSTVTDSMGRQTTFAYDVPGFPGLPWTETITDPAGRQTILTYDFLLNNLRSDLGQNISTSGDLDLARLDLWSTVIGNQFDGWRGDLSGVLKSITYPNGQTMTFKYNILAEVARIELPTGGAYEYDWDFATTSDNVLGLISVPSSAPDVGSFAIYRRVTERRVYDSSGVLEQKQDFGAPNETCGSPAAGGYPIPFTTQTAVTFKDGSGTVVGRETHTYYGAPDYNYGGPVFTSSCASTGTPPDEVTWLRYFPSWKTGREFQTDYGSSSPLLKTEQIQSQQRPCGSGEPCWFPSSNSPDANDDNAPAHDTRQIQTVDILGPSLAASSTSSKITCFDDYNNPSDVYEYDYGFSSGLVSFDASTSSCQIPSGWLRHTHTNYKTDSAYTDPAVNLVRLPIETDVYGSSAQATKTTYTYDNQSLTDRSAPQHDDTNFGTGNTVRDNLTQVSKGLGTSPPTTTIKYDILGNIVEKDDARSNATTFGFDGTCGYGVLTSMTNVALSQTATMDYYT